MTKPHTTGSGAGLRELVTTARPAQDNPTRLSESVTDVPVAQLWRQAVAKSKRESAARRARVLAHPDLARRLTDAPLGLSDPARWSGWIPPRTLAEEACVYCQSGKGNPACRGWPHRARVNDSPVRRQFVDIAAEAMRRESGQ